VQTPQHRFLTIGIIDCMYVNILELHMHKKEGIYHPENHSNVQTVNIV